MNGNYMSSIFKVHSYPIGALISVGLSLVIRTGRSIARY